MSDGEGDAAVLAEEPDPSASLVVPSVVVEAPEEEEEVTYDEDPDEVDDRPVEPVHLEQTANSIREQVWAWARRPV